MKLNRRFLFPLSILFFCGIVFSMDVWGLVPKAQDDPQLITEAITAAIVAHEADHDAHLGEDGSLADHKHNEVLDHPAGSVVSDKFSFSEVSFISNFSEHAQWSKQNVHDYEWPLMAVPEGGYSNYYSYMYVDLWSFLQSDQIFTEGALWQSTVLFYEFFDDSTAAVGFGVSTAALTSGFGFIRKSDGIYAWVKRGTDYDDVLIPSLAVENLYVLTAFSDPAQGKVFFLASGVLLAELDIPSTPASGGRVWGFQHHSDEDEGLGGLSVTGLRISLSL